MIVGSVARRYARAMLELATERGIADQVGADLASFVALLEREPALERTLLNPGFSRTQRRALLDELLRRASFDTIAENFLRLLIDKNRIDHLPMIVLQYGDLHDEQVGRIRAQVRAAVELQPRDVERLRDLLQRVTGKTVILEQQVDPTLIGGMVTKVGGLVFDGSLRTQLANMRQRLVQDTA